MNIVQVVTPLVVAVPIIEEEEEEQEQGDSCGHLPFFCLCGTFTTGIVMVCLSSFHFI